MKLVVAASYLVAILGSQPLSVNAQGQMVKMCFFYDNPSGHARSDPIINQQCASDHVHTFYGPRNFHPNTSYEDIRDTKPEESSTPFVENQSLYWHPSIYTVEGNTYTRVDNLETGPYYRWDNSVEPKTETFPPRFRMIAASNDPGANSGGELGANMFTECCDFVGDDEEECQTWNRLEFPSMNCDFLGLALAMPTCWDGKSLGDDNDHKSHMRYTTDGSVAGPCPQDFDHRLPQVQLFIRIGNYRGAEKKYQLADDSKEFHFDFMNGWEEGKLEQIIRDCPVPDQEIGDYNPECGCDQFLTPNPNVAPQMCDGDVRRLIIDEPIDVTQTLPRGTCLGDATLIDKSWNGPDLSSVNLATDCSKIQTPAPVTPTQPTPAPVTVVNPTPAPVTIVQPTPAPVTPPTPAPVPPTGGGLPTFCYEFAATSFDVDGVVENCNWLNREDWLTDEYCDWWDDANDQELYYTCPDQCGCYTDYETDETEADDCFDYAEDEFRFEKNDGSFRTKSCDWIAQDDVRIDRVCWRWDHDNDQEVYYTCPEECGCYTEWE